MEVALRLNVRGPNMLTTHSFGQLELSKTAAGYAQISYNGQLQHACFLVGLDVSIDGPAIVGPGADRRTWDTGLQNSGAKFVCSQRPQEARSLGGRRINRTTIKPRGPAQ